MSTKLLGTLSIVALVGSLSACSDQLAPSSSELSADPSALAKGSGSDDGRIEIGLAGSAAFPRANGKAKFRDLGGEQQLEIEVEDGPVNASIDFLVNGLLVASATTDAFGDGEINLNSDLGDAVPAVGAGTSVEVRAADGTVVVSGSF